MAAITSIALSQPRGQLLETIAIANQVADSTTVYKAIALPQWVEAFTVVIGTLTMAGTAPTFDFKLHGLDLAGGGAVDTDYIWDLAGWDGITQKTAAAGTYTAIDVGATYTADDTGSATASDRYAVQSAPPATLVYSYTTTGNNDDEDYDATISIYCRS